MPLFTYSLKGTIILGSGSRQNRARLYRNTRHASQTLQKQILLTDIKTDEGA